MRQAPAFWQHDGPVPRWLAPLSAVTAAVTARRLSRAGWYCPIPVICIGNVTVGGAGKTTVTLDLARRMVARHWDVHVLLRGYGRSTRGLQWAEPGKPASQVGDEALLHAEVAPTWTCGDRAAGARAALAAGAELLLLDDGLQNPGVRKDFSLLVIDGATGFGNGQVLPAGPLREPVAAAARRCQAAVLIGADAGNALAALPPELPVHRARLTPGPEAAELFGRRVLGFAGIAHPDKFFATLAETGANVVEQRSFPDHHRFTGAELTGLLEAARRHDAIPVTTAKDAVRLPEGIRRQIRVLTVSLAWEQPDVPDKILEHVINGWAAQGRYRRSYE
jgi:tetraacyldisaccharide 4'-kinase